MNRTQKTTVASIIAAATVAAIVIGAVILVCIAAANSRTTHPVSGPAPQATVTRTVTVAAGQPADTRPRLGSHAARGDWDNALAACIATGKYDVDECWESVGDGEF